ncbi:hypothetical protein [Stigmatella aurantiaca]|uniref:Uncharacterized protein n=1 Tax=Stigmatella aurantiaca (strain DW4/3-1) TaxID=378806 RepID=E3FG75_STIAD|nr:hypothetical protein [Stigmatella aurantiaca]ADO69010.1 uncharacterized protein STAUR_1206 [Stigmatella aurantiaca DW4/3-1]
MGFSKVMFFSGSILHETFAETETASETIARYSYLDYLRCVTGKLGTFLGQEPCKYLLYKGTPVLNQGSTRFELHQPGTNQFAGTETAVKSVLGTGTVVGAFARTASVASMQPAYNLPAKVYFVRDNKTGAYDVVKDGDELPPGKTRATYTLRGAQTTDAVGNTSSRIIKDDADRFVGQMLKAKIGFPAFSVCDCNSFHTSGYLWGTYAIRSVMDPGSDDAVAILNFDQHQDLGGGALVASDAWGLPTLASVKNGCYLSIGNAASRRSGEGLGGEYQWSTTVALRKDGATTHSPIKVMTVKTQIAQKAISAMTAEEKVQYYGALLSSLSSKWTRVDPLGSAQDCRLSDLKNATLGMPLAPGCTLTLDALDAGELFTCFFQALVQYLGRPIKYVFVTVDRDVIQNHHTQWGDKSLFPNGFTLVRTISTVHEALLAASPQCTLIGVDITGLPESRKVYGQWTDNIQPVASTWEGAEEQILKLFQWGESCLQSQSSATALFMYRMGIIFDNLTKDLKGRALRPYVSDGVRKEISTFWNPLRASFESSQKGGKGLITVVPVSMPPKLEEIASALRSASRTSGYISKEIKTQLIAYANRIDSLLKLEA